MLIATFHRVLPAALRENYPFPGLVVTPDELDWFLSFFSSHFVCGTLSESLDRWQTNEAGERPPLAITFDDAQLDNFAHARSVLARSSVHATFFAPAESVERQEMLWHDRIGYSIVYHDQQGRGALPSILADLELPMDWSEMPVAELASAVTSRAKKLATNELSRWVSAFEPANSAVIKPEWDGLMSWDQLVQLSADGHEIGSHSGSHQILPNCSEEELEREIRDSRLLIQDRLQVPVDTFCYPNGTHDPRVVAAVERAGYGCAVTTQWGMNESAGSRFTLHRCDIQAQHATHRDGSLSGPRMAWRMSGLHPGLV